MNKDQIKIKLQALPFFKGSLDLKYIEGFMANDNYIVSDDGREFKNNTIRDTSQPKEQQTINPAFSELNYKINK